MTFELKFGAAFRVSSEVRGLFSFGVRTSTYTTKQRLPIKSRPITSSINIATRPMQNANEAQVARRVNIGADR